MNSKEEKPSESSYGSTSSSTTHERVIGCNSGPSSMSFDPGTQIELSASVAGVVPDGK